MPENALPDNKLSEWGWINNHNIEKSDKRDIIPLQSGQSRQTTDFSWNCSRHSISKQFSAIRIVVNCMNGWQRRKLRVLCSQVFKHGQLSKYCGHSPTNSIQTQRSKCATSEFELRNCPFAFSTENDAQSCERRQPHKLGRE